MVKVALTPASKAAFVDAINKFAAANKMTIRDATLQQAALACQDAAKFTPPLARNGGNGLSKDAKKAGERAVERDVSKVFAPLTGGTADIQATRVIKRLGSLALNNNSGLFWKVASSQASVLSAKQFIARMLSPEYKGFGTEAGFKKAKNYFARVGSRVAAHDFSSSGGYIENVNGMDLVYRPIYTRNLGRLWKNGRNVSGVTSFTKRIVERKGDMAQYIEQRQEHVGAIKSGWAKSLMSLPKPKIKGVEANFGADLLKAVWITKHSSVAGNSTSSFSDKLADVTIRNLMGNIYGIADQADTLGLVYGNRVKQMPANVRKLIQADIDKFNNK